jgi:fructose-bisphosphate aldolase class I
VQENRGRYRELFYTADLGPSISGAILFKETLSQAASDGTPFVDCLGQQGVLPGIKVDEVGQATLS